MTRLLRHADPGDPRFVKRKPVDARAMRDAVAIVESVRSDGEIGLRRHAQRLGDLDQGSPLVARGPELEAAFTGLDPAHRDLLTRVAGRVERFASAQRDALTDVTVDLPGGSAGHRWLPVRSVGAYAPGGRHSLPSTVLMTVIPARVAGVGSVWLASPRPSSIVLAAAWLSGADGVVLVGGAQAIAALAFGTVSPRCDLIVGPGNKWVTAAKKHLFGDVGIDSLAGPSEIVVIADEAADPSLVAADLLAQAEHDVDAVAGLITTSVRIADEVDRMLKEQLADLSTAGVARESLGNGFVILVQDVNTAAEIADEIAPEHLALHVGEPTKLASKVTNFGTLLVGSSSAEAFADYGAGPNHVLPTGGGARFQAGLSVATFLKAATWLDIERPDELVRDTALLARLEGLEAHARAAAIRSAVTSQPRR